MTECAAIIAATATATTTNNSY